MCATLFWKHTQHKQKLFAVLSWHGCARCARKHYKRTCSDSLQEHKIRRVAIKHAGRMTDKDRLAARMEGAKAALEGRKMDANLHPEESDLHFEWLAGWTSAKLEQRKHDVARHPKRGE